MLVVGSQRVNVLEEFPFTISESELDYYHQKVNVRCNSWMTCLTERLNT